MSRFLKLLCACSIVLWTLTGCGEDSPAEAPVQPANAAAAGAAGGGASSSAANPATAKAAAAAARPTIPGVPDLDLTVVGTSEHGKARSHNGKALKHHKKKAWDEAITEYTQGLVQNPGHILQRYNLGCAYAMKGDHDKALTILKQFAYESDCILCQGRLKRATADTDYQSLWANPDFIGLTKGVNPVEPNYKKITKRFLKGMGKAYWGLMKRTVDNGHSFAVNVTKPRRGGQLIQDGSDLAKWKLSLGGKKATMIPGETEVYTVKCRNACCTVKTDAYPIHGQVAKIKNVCYWPISEKEAYIHRIKLEMF